MIRTSENENNQLCFETTENLKEMKDMFKKAAGLYENETTKK